MGDAFGPRYSGSAPNLASEFPAEPVSLSQEE